jgi:type 2 lantibiotic biosynthesis protein LanM
LTSSGRHEFEVRSATFDELLADGFETLPGRTADTAAADERLAAWCASSTSGQWPLFERRLRRDGWAPDFVRARFAGARQRDSAPRPTWADQLRWIRQLLGAGLCQSATPVRFPFGQLFVPLVDAADARLSDACGPRRARLTASARQCLRDLLMNELTGLCAPMLFERFTSSAAGYHDFVTAMDNGGLRSLLDAKPVLPRLIATLTQQWLTTTCEFISRLDADIDTVRRDLLGTSGVDPVVRVEGGLSDPHRGGRSVLLVEFADGRRVVYKPKDLRVDGAWCALIDALNAQNAPVALRTARTVVCDGYGWSEFIEHVGCADESGPARFFRRAGAWLALLHCFAAADMHHENVIAAGEHPVPVDLEATIQATDASDGPPEHRAHEAARALIAESVVAVGLLPGYARSGGGFHAVGGFAQGWSAGETVHWPDINTDAMRPERVAATPTTTNLPHYDGRYAGLGAHVDDFLAGFSDYAAFLVDRDLGPLLAGFAGVPVRKVLRPTQFYHLLLHRVRDDRTMDDGVLWSVQTDFTARLADWSIDPDPRWPLYSAERAALIELDVPMFVMRSDGEVITDAAGTSVATSLTPGLRVVRDRLRRLDDQEIAWQVALIRQTSGFVTHGVDSEHQRPPLPTTDIPVDLGAEADSIAEVLSQCAIRRGPGAAWIGLNWFPDSDISQLAVLGSDLYSGTCGIAMFFAAHAKSTGSASSAQMAYAAIARIREELNGANSSHATRLLGVGGGTGLGSVVYALAVIGDLLDDDALRADAHHAALLVTDELIAADRRLDAISGSAGAILGLLRLYADTSSQDVLARALRCGEHLLSLDRVGPTGSRMWTAGGAHSEPLNGMSHGAAGFGYALASLAAISGRSEFADAAAECLAFLRAGYDSECADWRDRRVDEPHWRSQWCHGAVGIGLAHLGMVKRGAAELDTVGPDIDNALLGAERGWPGHVDTLCCGALGGIELNREAGQVLGRGELGDIARQRLSAVVGAKTRTGSYRWNGGATRFNAGLFRGLSGVGYTCLRAIDDSLPNVLIWE